MSRITLEIEGMSCGHCIHAVREALAELSGVEVESVSIGSASIAFDESRSSMATILDAVADAGYSATPKMSGSAS